MTPARALALALACCTLIGLQGCAGSRGVQAPQAPAAAQPAAVPAPATGTNLVSGSGVPVGDGSGLAARSAEPSRAAVASPATPPAAPRAAPAPAPLVWPAQGTPVDAYLAALTPRQRECMVLTFERQDLTVERIRGMDAFPAGNLLELSRARCDAVLPRVDPVRLRSGLRCTLDLPGEPVSRCDEVFVRTVDGRAERLSPADALRAELEAGNDTARRVTIARVEREDAAAERLGGRAGGAATPVDPSRAASSGAASAVATTAVPSTPVAGTPPSALASPAAGPASGRAGASAMPVPRYQILITCGTSGHHLRVQDCFAGPKPSSLELRRSDGSRHVYGPSEILRAGPTGKDGLSLLLDAPFELRARNTSDTLLLGVRVVDRGSGRTVSFEQASKGGSVSAKR